MPRYIVERTFTNGLNIPMSDVGARVCKSVIANNAGLGVTWLHSYVTPDHKQTFCIYDAPTPEAIRIPAKQSEMPADRITEVSVLDPYFYRL